MSLEIQLNGHRQLNGHQQSQYENIMISCLTAAADACFRKCVASVATYTFRAQKVYSVTYAAGKLPYMPAYLYAMYMNSSGSWDIYLTNLHCPDPYIQRSATGCSDGCQELIR